MAQKQTFSAITCVSRRGFLQTLAAVAAFSVTAKDILSGASALAQAPVPGVPLPDEPVEATLKRLFGNRPLNSGDGRIKLELPLIAEDGGNVAVAVDTNLPVGGATRASHIYIISDKNRRPMLAKFSLTPESGKASITTSIRLATTTDVRAIVEMNDGTLYSVSKHVRVTISGCDLPPAG
ncbi:MAG: thiosulfate oxidation carrier protein SoxY [Candidatus Binatia bacterium]